MYYVTTGFYVSENSAEKVKESVSNKIESSTLFSNIDIIPSVLRLKNGVAVILYESDCKEKAVEVKNILATINVCCGVCVF